MFFGKEKRRKSWNVGTPEYDQYEEFDNRQDMYNLQERMKKHGFAGGPGINKDRWMHGDKIFDIDRPFGPAAEVWDMSEKKYNELVALLDDLDKMDANESPHRKKIKRNLKNLLVSVPGTDPDDVSSGYRDDVQTFLDSYGETVLGDGQDPDNYQEYRQLDLEGKWDFVKEYEGKSEEELTNDFWKWKYDEDLDWDEDNMTDEFYNLMEVEDEEHDNSESTDADSINIADFDDEIKESGGDVNKIVERIIDLSKTTDMSSDDIEYMRDVLTQKVKDYIKDKKPESTNLGGIAKSITQNDLGRSL